MDTTTLVPAGGLAAVIVVLVGYLLRQLVADRRDYQEAIKTEQARTQAAEARTAAALDAADEAQARVDAEREKRRDAETAAASASSELIAQRHLLEYYAREAARMSSRPPRTIGGAVPDSPDEDGPQGEVPV